MTSDTESAAEFFGKVAGWKAKPWEQDPNYFMFMAGQRPMGGLMTLPEEAKAGGTPSTWVTYIGTPDVDETALRAAQLGGRVLRQPADIPTVGRFAILQDPQGAMFAAFTPTQMPPAPTNTPEAMPGVGDFSWHELATTDWRGALAFYQHLFGWEATSAMDDPAFGTYQMYGLAGKTLGGMFNRPAGMGGPPAWLAYIRVPDAKKSAVAIAKAGGKIVNGPMEVPGGDWIAQGVDLQGVMFAVHSVKPAAKAPATRKRPARKKTAPRKAAPKRKTAPGRKSSVARPRKKAATRTATKKGARKQAARRGGARKRAARRARR